MPALADSSRGSSLPSAVGDEIGMERFADPMKQWASESSRTEDEIAGEPGQVELFD